MGSDTKAEVKRAARRAESNRPFRVLARAGYAANGLMHVLVGVIVLIVAFGGSGQADQAGAFTAVATAPLGFAALWAVAIGLWALGAWHAAEGLLAREPSGDGAGTARKWWRRAAEWGQALVFLALGFVAAAVALGARPDVDESAQHASRGILSLPGGALLLGAIGVGFGIAGVAFVGMGLARSFRRLMRIPDGATGGAVVTLGVVGFLAKGAALLILGVLLVVAAVRVDPSAAGGLDAAVTGLLALPLGPWLAVAVGAGLVVYGVFCGLRARYARL